jgi:pimeloyl-ACP methyl ester carboxylesterase
MNSPAHSYLSDRAPTQTIAVGNVAVAFRRLGPADGMPLLLLQRFRATMDHWDPEFIDGLLDRPVIMFDSVGVGRTEGIAAPDIAAMADFAAAFAGAMDLQTVDVLGWSMGGAVAQSLSLRHPALVRRIVVAGSGPGGVPDAPSAPAKVWEVAGKPVNDAGDFLYLFFADTTTSIAAGQRHLARLGRRHEPFGPQVKPESVMAQFQALTKWTRGIDSAYVHLQALAHPTLVANGVHDIMVDAYQSYVMSRRMPNAELILYPDAGHGFLFQYATTFAQRVRAFLDAPPIAT